MTNLKQFLKPDWRKILLTVLLLLTILTFSISFALAQSDENTLYVIVIERVGSSEIAITNAEVTLDFGTIIGERSSIGIVDTSSGEAVFSNLNPGVYTVSVRTTGYISAQKEFTKEVGKAGRLTIALEKAPEGATGSIKIELKRIAPQTPVYVSGKIEILKEGEVIRSSNTSGEVLFSDLPVGKYTAYATAPGYIPETKEFEIEAGKEGWLGFILEPLRSQYEFCPKNCTCDDQTNVIECHGREVAEKGVEISTDAAIQIVKDGGVLQDVKEIKFDEKKITYEISGFKSARLFWFIPVQMDIKTSVNAKTGVLEKVDKPWWSFLVW